DMDTGETFGAGIVGNMNNIVQRNRSDGYGGWGFNNPTTDLVEAFEEGDPRLEATVIKDGDFAYGEYQTIDPTQHMSPYINRKIAIHSDDMPSTDRNGPTNDRKFRYADLLLIRAEAAYHVGNENEARLRLNQVRDRARQSTHAKGAVAEGVNDYAPYTSEEMEGVLPRVEVGGPALLQAILHERRVELAMENLRL